jgi:hypothetical protein
MKRIVRIILVAIVIVQFTDYRVVCAVDQLQLLTGTAAFGDWHDDAPGVRRKISVADLPRPFATESAGNDPHIVPRPSGAEPKVPVGFVADEFASGLDHPRAIRAAPNGDLFVSESYSGRIRVLRAPDGAIKAQREEIFASGLTLHLASRSGRLDPIRNLSMSPTRIRLSVSPIGTATSSRKARLKRSWLVFPPVDAFEAAAIGRAMSSSP